MTAATDTTERTRTFRLGTNEHDETVYAVVTLRPDRPTPAPHETTDHEAAATCTEVSVIHETYRKGRRPPREGETPGQRHEPDSLGASREPFLGVVVPAEGWTHERIEELALYGDRWHLNAMRAACSHQVVRYEEGRYGRRPSLTETRPCTRTGYRYGSAWLVEPLPEMVLGYFDALVASGLPPAWHVERDGETLAGPFELSSGAWTWILQHQGQSVDWATTYEGYAIVARPVE